ncbi:hypothetical protein PCANC_12142 [Puccinia coronata f. sp. avenae]|uniref:Uncharacterized protein n=1 Tax=Puccinia coronata f. sp. avenae TaxID=200324 RepID=A0A2N5VGG3_9BASI|nr:hypothetical protein PCANC_14953 [Puccinia coronata f. sp. avenae]PLW23155.1 hypothetical protein PCASD_16511 [Puccinia coronata f. sp. avenae]PLW49093.1 hypothetical protein PCANC_12142 [Puccinia coronata f. sp. avenae]
MPDDFPNAKSQPEGSTNNPTKADNKFKILYANDHTPSPKNGRVSVNMGGFLNEGSSSKPTSQKKASK